MGKSLSTIVALWFLIVLHAIAFVALAVIHVVNTKRAERRNFRIHMAFTSMYMFILSVILTLAFDLLDESGERTSQTTIWNVLSFLTSVLNHFFQYTYFFVSLEVMFGDARTASTYVQQQLHR